MKLMSLCHECVCDSTQQGQTNYKGPSPDEEALVEFAKNLGFEYLEGNDHRIKLKIRGENYEFDFFRRIEFTSDRKRASILIKDPTDGKIKLLVKGADNIIDERLCFDQNP